MAAKFCDVNLCDKLDAALGHFILWVVDAGAFYMHIELVRHIPLGAKNASFMQSAKELIPIDYCPFCGTRLDEVGTVQVRKIIASEKRGNIKKARLTA